MADLRLLDRAYTAVNERMIATGQTPHYTELARELGLSMEAGRHLLRDLIGTGSPRGCTRTPTTS